MTDDELTQKVAAFRAELKEKPHVGRPRKSASGLDSKTDGTVERNIQNSADASGRASKVGGSNSGKDQLHLGQEHNSVGDDDKDSAGIRSAGGRHVHDYSSADSTPPHIGLGNANTAGRLIADEEPRKRVFKSIQDEATAKVKAVVGKTSADTRGGKAREAKEQKRAETFDSFASSFDSAGNFFKTASQKTSNFKLPFFKEGKVLSEVEAKALYDPLKASLSDDAGYLDEFIWYKTKDALKQPIWSDLDDEEIEKLVQLALKQGRKNEVAASAVRGIVNSSGYFAAGAILWPRIQKTATVLSNAPKDDKPKRKLFANRIVHLNEENKR